MEPIFRTPTRSLEQALIDLAYAEDGTGLRVNLEPFPLNAQSLLDATRQFAARVLDPSAQIVGETVLDKQDRAAASLENLALLAAATAAAIREIA